MNYQEGKVFLKDAELVRESSTDTYVWRTWRKPDGSEWHENESRLEAPEDDYDLRRDVAVMGKNFTYTAWLKPGKRICVQCGRDTGDGPIFGHTCLACYNANGFRQFTECQP